mgnify:CR=1 FL=1
MSNELKKNSLLITRYFLCVSAVNFSFFILQCQIIKFLLSRGDIVQRAYFIPH